MGFAILRATIAQVRAATARQDLTLPPRGAVGDALLADWLLHTVLLLPPTIRCAFGPVVREEELVWIVAIPTLTQDAAVDHLPTLTPHYVSEAMGMGAVATPSTHATTVAERTVEALTTLGVIGGGRVVTRLDRLTLDDGRLLPLALEERPTTTDMEVS